MQDGGFTSTVRPDQAKRLTTTNAQGEFMQNFHLAVTSPQRVNRQEGITI
jgi:hypothetical protein